MTDPKEGGEVAMRVITLPKDPSTLVGVYGTLKKDYGNHPILNKSKYMGNSSVEGIMLHLGGFPMLIKQLEEFQIRPGFRVTVEVYKVDPTTLTRLDQLEGHPRFYERRKVGTDDFGLIEVYYGHTKEEWKGIRNLVWDGKWRGSATTPFLQIDFNDGTKKPTFKPKTGMNINFKTGEVTFEKNQDTDSVEITGIRPPATPITNIPDPDTRSFFKREGSIVPFVPKEPAKPEDVVIRTDVELTGYFPTIKQI